MKRALLSLAFALSMFVIGATASYADDGSGCARPPSSDYGLIDR